MFVISLIVFIFILSILILVHEWGHYIAAVKCGVKVEQFALGFGPKLYSVQKGDTEFCLCAIPLGGYVKMAGDERDKTQGHAQEFLSKTVGQRTWIVLMGPLVNLVLAYVCFYGVFVIGFVDTEAMSKNIKSEIGQILSDSPASQAGLKVGDVVVAINGQPVQFWYQLQEQIAASKDNNITLKVLREGQEQIIEVKTKIDTQKDIFGRNKEIRRIGVGAKQVNDPQELIIKRYDPITSLGKAASELWDITCKTYKALYEMCIGVRSPKEAMGLVGMFFVIKFALSVGFSFLLHIVGVISASLAIFNLLPILPLDGGHILLLAIEKWRGKKLSSQYDVWMGRVGLTMILLLAVFVFYADVERVGWIDKIMHLIKG